MTMRHAPAALSPGPSRHTAIQEGSEPAFGELQEPMSSAINSLREMISRAPSGHQKRRSCAVCRPLEMYRSTRELVHDARPTAAEPTSTEATRQFPPSGQLLDKHARMDHVAKQAKSVCSCCALLLQVYKTAYAAKSVFWCPVEGLEVRRVLAKSDTTTLQFKSAGMYNVEVELFYEPRESLAAPDKISQG